MYLIADSAIGAIAFETLSPTSSDSIKPIETGSLKVYDRDDNLVVYQINGNGGKYFSSNRVKANECYRMEFNSALGISTAQACIPSQPHVTVIDSGRKVGSLNDSVFFLNISLKDSLPQTNYYKISCIGYGIQSIRTNSLGKQDTSYGWIDLEVNTNSLSYFVNENNYDNAHLLLKDDIFNQTSANLNFEVGVTGIQKVRFFIDAIDENLFEYHRTEAAQNFVQTDPNAHYITVYNNITNGFGIMGGLNRVQIIWLNH